MRVVNSAIGRETKPRVTGPNLNVWIGGPRWNTVEQEGAVSCEYQALCGLIDESMKSRDVDDAPNFPRVCLIVSVETDSVASSDCQNARVIDDVGTTAPVCSERFDGYHVDGIDGTRVCSPAVSGRLWITLIGVVACG